jgi:hypothetical protein
LKKNYQSISKKNISINFLYIFLKYFYIYLKGHCQVVKITHCQASLPLISISNIIFISNSLLKKLKLDPHFYPKDSSDSFPGYFLFYLAILYVIGGTLIITRRELPQKTPSSYHSEGLKAWSLWLWLYTMGYILYIYGVWHV